MTSLRRLAVLAHASVLDGSAYARRVLDHAVAVRRAGIVSSAAVWTVEGPGALRRRDARVAVSSALDRAGVELRILHAWPRRAGLAGLSDRLAAKALRRLAARSPVDAIHAHGPRAARTALRAVGPRTPVVVDVHDDGAAGRRLERRRVLDDGAPPDESVASVLREAHAAVYASEALAERFPVADGLRRAVVPGVVADDRIPTDERAEAERAARRKAMGLLGAERLVAYAGGLSAGDEVERLARIVRHLVERVPQARFLILTPDPAAGERLLRAAGLPRGVATAVSTAGGDAIGALLATDAGVVLRRPALANALAFPTAFGEHLAAGAAVATSDAVPALASRIAAQPALGFSLPFGADDATWAARLSGAARPSSAETRAARRAWVRKDLSWSSVLPRLEFLYSRL